MMGKSVGGSEVIVSTHNVETHNEAGVRQAVLVRNATKSYGAGSNRCAVLEGLNMTVNLSLIHI